MNWNNFTYRQKNKTIVIGALLFLVVVYQLALSKTWDLYVQNNALEEKLATVHESLKNKDEVENKQAVLEQRIASFFVDSLSHQDLLIETVSRYCHMHRILLRELPAMNTYTEGDFQVGTYKVVLEGDYKTLLQLVYLLEQKNKIGRVSSASFILKFDNKRKKDILSLVIYLQNIQLHAYEEKSE